MPAIELNSKNFKKEVLESETPVMVNFHANWCFQCRTIEPLIDDLSDEYKGKFKVGKLNYDENKKTGEKYNIKSIPTLLVFVNGEEKERFEEVDPEEDLNAILDKYLVKKAKKIPAAKKK